MYQLAEKRKSDSRPVIQTSLKIGQPGDKYEQEADAVADRVMMMSEPGTMQMQPEEEEESLQMQPIKEHLLQMKCKECEEEEMLQTKSGKSSGFANKNLSNQIQSARGNGTPLSDPAIQFMNKAMDANFNDVKVHDNLQSHQINRQLGSRAFTYGSNIFFNKGEYHPESKKGRKLIAHELTHTLQQGKVLEKRVQKYSHEDCDETADLRPHIWPADHLAKNMVNRGITALTASAVTAATNSVLDRHFKSHSASTIASVLRVLQSIKAAFDSDDYTYECEDDCEKANAYVYGLWSDVHLCMNRLRGRDNQGIAAVIVHEFSHYYGGTDDVQYYFSFGSGTIPSSLTTSDAVRNADSYEGFAYEI